MDFVEFKDLTPGCIYKAENSKYWFVIVENEHDGVYSGLYLNNYASGYAECDREKVVPGVFTLDEDAYFILVSRRLRWDLIEEVIFDVAQELQDE